MEIKKADEMEMQINIKSSRLAYFFVVISLLVWIIVDFVRSSDFPYIQLSIICLQNAIFFGSKAYLTRKMTREKNEK